MKKYCLLFCGALLYLHTSCFAWWAEGHMIIAQIAHNNLTKTTRDSVENLLNYPLDFPSINSSTSYLPPPRVLNQELNTFVLASPWSDGVKHYNWINSKENPKYSQLHYLAVGIDATDLADCSQPKVNWIDRVYDHMSDLSAKKEGDVINGIKSSLKTLMVAAESKENKEVALRYLIHLVGDIHQPFHMSDPTFVYVDPKTHQEVVVRTYGANGIVMPTFTIPNYMPYSGLSALQNITEWHAFWDAAVGAYENIDGPINSYPTPHAWDRGWSPTTAPNYRKEYLAYVAKQAQSIEAICRDMPDLSRDVSVVGWAAKSTENSCKLLSPNNYGFEFEPYETGSHRTPYKVKLLNFNETSYEQSTKLIAKMHIGMAGYRLANLLNALYDPASAPVFYREYLDKKIKQDQEVVPLAQYIQDLL